MSRKRSDKDYLADIQEAIERVQQYTEGYSFERFVDDRKTQDAVVRNLEIIGEAAKAISSTLKERYPEIPWKSMAGLRDRLIHHYFGINYEIVWQVVTEELPKLKGHIRRAMGDE